MDAELRSSHGSIVFDTQSGFVKSEETDLGPEFGPAPYKIDVDEWRLRYPGESMEGEHDVLDFGYWYHKGRSSSVYEPPCEDWRRDREDRLRAEEMAGRPALAGETK